VTARVPRSAARLITRQRRTAERLRREILGLDGSLRHPYFRAFLRGFGDPGQVVAEDDLVAAATRAGLVFVSDFHAVPAYPRYAARLLRALAAGQPPLALGVEFLYTRQQALLDERQAGRLDDERFLRRVHYHEEWGYPFEGYRDLLDAARELGVRVHALDAPPRGGFAGLRARDEHAARRIAAILREDAGTRLLVLFGESHLAASHLPRRVRSRLEREGRASRDLVVLQNPDAVYWRLLGRGERPGPPVRLDARTFAVFHTSPLEKYEAYRQVLEHWGEEAPPGAAADLTPAAHDLIGVLARWVGLRRRRRVRHRAGWSEDLADAYPEVYSGDEAIELIEPILLEQGRTPEELEEARRALTRRGALYDSRSNALFLPRYLPGAAAGEGARFLRAALTGRLFIAAQDFAGSSAASLCAAAYTDALAYLGARLVDPTTDYLDDEPEAPRAALPTGEWLAGAGRARAARRALARALGRRAGRSLLARVREGVLDGSGLRRMFTRVLTPRTARVALLGLLDEGACPGPGHGLR